MHACALDLESRTDAPWLRVEFEELFGGNDLERLLDFLDVPQRESIFALKGRKVDEHEFLIDHWPNWRTIENHPRVLAIADELGYSIDFVETSFPSRWSGTDRV